MNRIIELMLGRYIGNTFWIFQPPDLLLSVNFCAINNALRLIEAIYKLLLLKYV